jgi:hypothetical protein
MELITTQINFELKILIDQSYESVKHEFNMTNNRISHINIYHKDWSNNYCENIINLLYSIYNINPQNIISLGWINGQVNCLDQHFHIDYQGQTHTYFIPIVELNDFNGTEYIKFTDTNFNIQLIDTLIDMSDKYICQEQIQNDFESLKICQTQYEFKILNSPAYSMVWMPNYVLHRGRKNQTQINKIMFQIVIGTSKEANISSNIKFDDSELDEEPNIVGKLITSRLQNQNFQNIH